jgi:transcription elongation GreA/GreB family factor
VQSLISGEQTKHDNTLVVSWDSLARRKEEYTELVQKKIPANSKEIAIARSYGDLRENHEYKAAKEMQKILMRRKGELENLLGRARGLDFSNPNTEQVSIGTTVAATDLIAGGKETYSIMGAWDSEPERGIISYLSPVGHAFLNRKAGEEIDYEMEGVRKCYRIDSITAAPPLVAPQPRAASAPEAEPTGTSSADQA